MLDEFLLSVYITSKKNNLQNTTVCIIFKYKNKSLKALHFQDKMTFFKKLLKNVHYALKNKHG